MLPKIEIQAHRRHITYAESGESIEKKKQMVGERELGRGGEGKGHIRKSMPWRSENAPISPPSGQKQRISIAGGSTIQSPREQMGENPTFYKKGRGSFAQGCVCVRA